MAAKTALLLAMNRKYGVEIPTKVRYFLVSKMSRPALLPILPKFHAYRSSFLEVKRLKPEAVHSPKSSAEVKNEWSCNTTPLYSVHTDKFTFFFTLLFYPEDGGSRVLRNDCNFLPDYKKPHPREQ